MHLSTIIEAYSILNIKDKIIWFQHHATRIIQCVTFSASRYFPASVMTLRIFRTFLETERVERWNYHFIFLPEREAYQNGDRNPNRSV